MSLLISHLLQPCGSRTRAWLGLLFFALAGGAVAQGTTPVAATPSEYQLKAVFLYNFTQFVEWPETSFSHAQAPFVIGVLGDDPFGPYLDEAVVGEKVNQHPLAVRRYRRAEEVDDCHVLFISPSENEHLTGIVERLKNRSILVVGEGEGFTLRGGMIRFVTEKNKVRLKINLEAAKTAGLVISSKLLKPAEIVTAGKN